MDPVQELDAMAHELTDTLNTEHTLPEDDAGLVFVHAEDYDAVCSERDALRARVAELEAGIRANLAEPDPEKADAILRRLIHPEI